MREVLSLTNMSPEKKQPTAPKAKKKRTSPGGVERHWTRAGADPYEGIEWEERTARIGSEEDPVFEQHGVEVPAFWSQNATNIVAQKYFAYGEDDPRRERSVRQMIDRVVNRITKEGTDRGYFRRGEAQTFSDELKYILVHQLASFNSPVWFNIGVEGAPQTSSACFILSLEDTLESITNWYSEEARIFQAGSGAGINLSALRGSGEALSRGGVSSGPVTFMRAADASAGTIQSGGVTRRAAKMVILDDDHPDVEDFIWCKAREEERVHALRAAGFDMSMDSRAMAESTSYQNANQSVRLSDEFMQAVRDDETWQLRARGDGETMRELPARQLLREIAEAAWRCADPGVQYDSTIQHWHTTPEDGRITASNPCSEFLSNDNTSCNLASLNLLLFLQGDGTFDIEGFLSTVRTIFLAQEITISFADFPTRKIARRTRELRQIGIGYSNLGALLMSLGLPYDSEEGRQWAATLTALLTGEAYHYSTRIAERIGPFERFEANREHTLRVLRQHRLATKALPKEGPALPLARAAKKIWQDTCKRAEEWGVRNAQASVLAPTGCLRGSSMVLTDRGLARLDELGREDGPRWQDTDFLVQTDEGPKEATRFFVNGESQVVRLRTKRGYSLEGTPEHRIKDADGRWNRLGDITSGKILPLRLGGMIGQPRKASLPPLDEPYFASSSVRAPEEMSTQLAELVGYFMGDGSLHARGLRFQVAGEDRDIVKLIGQRSEELFGISAHQTEFSGHIQVEIHSTQLASWWRAAGFSKRKPRAGHSGKGWVPHIPSAVRASNDPEIYAAFLRGLFEADGGAYYTHTISFSTARADFAEEIRTLLLLLRIPTSTKIDEPTGNHKVQNPVHVLRVLNRYFAQEYARAIGFLSSRKQSALDCIVSDDLSPSAYKGDHIPISRETVQRLLPSNTPLRANLYQAIRRGKVSRRLALDLHSETGDEGIGRMLEFFFDRVESAELGESFGTYDLSVPDNTTYLANGMVSHNTISFMMDCDTTGIEPDFALIKHKTLVGGGSLAIANASVPRALKTLGYSSPEIDEIVEYLEEEIDHGGHRAPRGSLEGAPGLREEDLPVFDCAVGDRSISPEGHVAMMSAVQPFLSGAISKTVNVPSSATSEDIFRLYQQGWEDGLKALAIYRDGSKANQPLAEKKSVAEDAEEKLFSLLGDGLRRGERRKVPRDAQVAGTKFVIRSASQPSVSGYIHIRLFEDGTPGSIFIDVGQAGSTLHGFIRAWSVTFGLGLQYGMPLDMLVSKLAFSQFEPAGMTDDDDIRTAKSIVDYVVRWMAVRFLDASVFEMLGIRSDEENGSESIPGGKLQEKAEVVSPTRPASEEPLKLLASYGAGVCDICSGQLVRTGACTTCLSCGNSGGCG